MRELQGSKLLTTLADLAVAEQAPSAEALEALDAWLASADEAALEAARQDFLALFFSTRHLPAPPWESVYTSPERLVNQEAAREVLRAYAEAEVAFDGWRQVPSDHISLELAFAATLLAQLPRVAEARERLARFEAQPLAVWVPRFCADLKAAAKTPLYQHLADALAALVTTRPVG